MCYSGCKYENRQGGCKKPYDKKCPMEIDEKLQEEKIKSPCDSCRNFYVYPDETIEISLEILEELMKKRTC